jgi:hypothetical protein
MEAPMRPLIRLACALAVAGLMAAGVRADDAKYGDGKDGLTSLWKDLMAAANDGKEDVVKGLLSGMVMSADDFKAVFKDEAKAKEFAGKYADKYAKKWAGDAKGMSAKIKDKGFDNVIVVDVTADAKQQTGNDKKIVPLLKDGQKMYCVRLAKGDKKVGLRYDSFFFVNGKWVTGLRLGAFVGGDSDKGSGSGSGSD